MFSRKFMMGIATAAMTLAIPSVASAAFIQFWDFDVTSNWDNVVPGSIVPTLDGDDSVISWGTSSNGGEQSSLRVTNNVLGTIEVNDGAAPAVMITHNNFTISGASLTSTDLLTQITLTPGGGGASEFFSQTFNIEFTETPNSGSCQEGSVSVCDDIFALLNPNALSVSFSRDGYLYTAQLVVLGLSGGTLHNADVNEDGNVDLVFFTEEGQSAMLSTGIIMTARAIPEPAALGLAGVGLMGVGLAARRRRR